MTGFFALDGGAMFGVVPKVVWEKTNPADERNRIQLAMRSLLVETNDRVILIDAGVGDKYDAKFTDTYGIHLHPCLLESLLACGKKPTDITDIVITHFHFDHAGGLTRLRNGVTDFRPNSPDKVELVFPNARVWAQKKNYEWALKPSEKDRASFFTENFLPIKEAGKLELLQGDEEIIPGIKIWNGTNHTPGHQIVELATDDGPLVFCGDLIPTSSHIKIPFVMGYDLYPMDAMSDKKKLLDRMIRDDGKLFFEHDPQIAIATPFFDGKNYGWK